MPKVVSKSAETNVLSDYFVSALAGPKVAGRRVVKGEKLNLSEHQARAELLSGALVQDEALVDDPWAEKAAATAVKADTDKVPGEAKVADTKAVEPKVAVKAAAAGSAQAPAAAAAPVAATPAA